MDRGILAVSPLKPDKFHACVPVADTCSRSVSALNPVQRQFRSVCAYTEYILTSEITYAKRRNPDHAITGCPRHTEIPYGHIIFGVTTVGHMG